MNKAENKLRDFSRLYFTKIRDRNKNFLSFLTVNNNKNYIEGIVSRGIATNLVLELMGYSRGFR